MAPSSVTLPRHSQCLKAKGGIAKKSTKAARTIRYGLTQQPRFDDNLCWTTGRFGKLTPGKRFSGLLARLTVPWSTEWVQIPELLNVTAKAPAEVLKDSELYDDEDPHFVADLARAKAQSVIEYLILGEIMGQETDEALYSSEEDDGSLDQIALNGVFTTDYQPDEGNDLEFDEARFEEV
ncbi:hypothetical protein FN846DRAFT_892797 [Sphaerosporella brunnea]|uniref:Uncharacterized protein n=1 Tax=Sphaerosporella brunnea TaxID=1250544 RepID=A0A5J5ENA3_9PEZI|nr:hypothetical protein FN846DRAFT_892797 [Sphaerosporella brunnea]